MVTPPADPERLRDGARRLYAATLHIREQRRRTTFLIDALVRGGHGWLGLGGAGFKEYWGRIDEHMKQLADGLEKMANALESFAQSLDSLRNSHLAMEVNTEESMLGGGLSSSWEIEQAYLISPDVTADPASQLLSLFFDEQLLLGSNLDLLATEAIYFKMW